MGYIHFFMEVRRNFSRYFYGTFDIDENINERETDNYIVVTMVEEDKKISFSKRVNLKSKKKK